MVVVVQEPRINRFKAVFDPLNLLLIFANITAFVAIETFFFWNIASKSVDNTVHRKGAFLANMANYRPDGKLAMILFLHAPSNSTDLVATAKEQKKEREKENWDLVKSLIFPVMYVLLGINGLLIFVIAARRETFTTVDAFLLLCVVAAFSTELIFFALVINQLEYIGDMEIIDKTVVPAIANKNDWTPIL